MTPDENRRPHMFPSSDGAARPSVGTVANWAVIGIFLILLFGFFAQARNFLMPVTLAILLFFVFIPFRRLMERLGVSATVTAAIVSLGLVVSVVVIGFLVSGPVNRLIENAPQISTRLEQRLTEIRQNFRGIERAAEKLDEITGGGDSPEAPPGASGTLAPDATLTGTLSSPAPPGQPAQPDQKIEVQVQTAPETSTLASVLNLGPAFVGQIIFTLFLLFF